MFRSKLFVISFLILTGRALHAQIQVDYISMKDFKSVGFGGFFNASFPVAEADFITAEIGLDLFSKDDDHVATFPVLLGFRYTLDRRGAGVYLEPNAGYSFGGTDIEDVNYVDEKLAGPATGLSLGYLFQPGGRIQFTIALRYEHIFGNVSQDLFSFRIAHAFMFGRRE